MTNSVRTELICHAEYRAIITRGMFLINI